MYLFVCVRACVYAHISGSVVSSDKTRTGSTSVQRKENPSNRGGGACVWNGGVGRNSGRLVK